MGKKQRWWQWLNGYGKRRRPQTSGCALNSRTTHGQLEPLGPVGTVVGACGTVAHGHRRSSPPERRLLLTGA
jgi:hypothetical protein